MRMRIGSPFMKKGVTGIYGTRAEGKMTFVSLRIKRTQNVSFLLTQAGVGGGGTYLKSNMKTR